ncbi:hypothetical protein BDR22DRAFT_824251 [Usnea florida]
MFSLKVIIALTMIFSSLAVGLVEPMPEAVDAAPVGAENAAVPRAIEASFRNVPAPEPDFDDDHQGDGDNEAGIAPAITWRHTLKVAMCCGRSIRAFSILF